MTSKSLPILPPPPTTQPPLKLPPPCVPETCRATLRRQYRVSTILPCPPVLSKSLSNLPCINIEPEEDVSTTYETAGNYAILNLTQGEFLIPTMNIWQIWLSARDSRLSTMRNPPTYWYDLKKNHKNIAFHYDVYAIDWSKLLFEATQWDTDDEIWGIPNTNYTKLFKYRPECDGPLANDVFKCNRRSIIQNMDTEKDLQLSTGVKLTPKLIHWAQLVTPSNIKPETHEPTQKIIIEFYPVNTKHVKRSKWNIKRIMRRHRRRTRKQKSDSMSVSIH